MGKPYEKELDELPAVYTWALEQPIENLAKVLQAISRLPLLTIGSGGSFTTADFAACVHRHIAGQLAFPLTPMEVAGTDIDLRSSGVVLFTAGGKNPDILGAFQKIIHREPSKLLVICTRVRTPLSRLAGRFHFVDFIELGLPTGKDGFLATNSLVATTVLFLRAYAAATGAVVSLPVQFHELLDTRLNRSPSEIDKQFQSLWEKETLVVLHGPTTRSAAIDLESKFTEAALGNVQIADYRNFAHGRHHWLAKHPDSTGVIAFTTPENEATSSRTVQLFPRGIPVARIRIPHRGVSGSLAALAQVLFIVGSAGRARGIDPGRPGVPPFGRRIYHLKAVEYAQSKTGGMSPQESIAIARKVGLGFPPSVEQTAFWQHALASFCQRLQKTYFRGVVLDYDGTLCGQQHRFLGLEAAMARALARLLREGLGLGIATGRGKSVRDDLQKHLPEKYWHRVVVGYYNGGDIGLLADNGRPDGTKHAGKDLSPLAEALLGHPLLPKLVDFECRLPQIQVQPKAPILAETVWRILQQAVHNAGVPGASVLRSSHSIDIVAPGVTKQTVVARLADMLGKPGGPVLCIGDRGQWPGNDFSLLAGPYSLSVDEVSQDPLTCWNLAPPGFRGVQATLEYLKSMQAGQDGMRLVLKAFHGRHR